MLLYGIDYQFSDGTGSIDSQLYRSKKEAYDRARQTMMVIYPYSDDYEQEWKDGYAGVDVYKYGVCIAKAKIIQFELI